MFEELRKLLDQYEKGLMTPDEYMEQIALVHIKYDVAFTDG